MVPPSPIKPARPATILPRNAAPAPIPGRLAAPPAPILPAAARSSALQPQPGGCEVFALPPSFRLRPAGTGQRLPDALQRKMESLFQADFSNVRVHVGNEASSIGAQAFTIGTDLYFAPGLYRPETPQGQQLLGHELTHVVQQRAGRVRNPLGSGLAVVQDRSLEYEAMRMGMRAAMTEPIRVGSAGQTARGGAILPKSASGAPQPPATSAILPTRPSLGWRSLSRVVQRKGADHNNWIVQVIDDQKNAIIRQVKIEESQKKNPARGLFLKADSFALHHIISKTTLESIADAVEEALRNKKDKDLQKAASAFNTLIYKVAGKTVGLQAPTRTKLMWNMPLNLEVGPGNVTNNPGIGFDANTVASGNGRKLDEVSRHLFQLEEIFKSNVLRADGLSEENWKAMTDCLAAAFKAYGESTDLAMPKVDQWLSGPMRDGTQTPQNFQKIGLRMVLGVTDGVRVFRGARVGLNNDTTVQDLENHGDFVAWSCIFTFPYLHGKQTFTVRVELDVTNHNLAHMLKRHTFRYCDFGDLKAVNNYWPPTFRGNEILDALESCKGRIASACQMAINNCVLNVQQISEEPDDIQAYFENINVTEGNIQAGELTVYFVTKLTTPDDAPIDRPLEVWLHGNIETFAPDGASAITFSGPTLIAIAPQV
jgi:hypothetical protein